MAKYINIAIEEIENGYMVGVTTLGIDDESNIGSKTFCEEYSDALAILEQTAVNLRVVQQNEKEKTE